MTVINFKVDEEKKKKIEEIVKLKGYKSISEFIREAIEEKMNLNKVVDDFLLKSPQLKEKEIDIPDFIPDGKYLGIARNEIVVTGDSVDEVMKTLLTKFPESATAIIRKGKKIENFETLFSLFSAENTRCFHQTKIENNYFPILEFNILIDDRGKSILGLVDTGATIMALDKSLFQDIKLSPTRQSKILTPNGIIELPIFKGNFKYSNVNVELEFVLTNIGGPLAIQALIGKNFIDKFNLLVLGNEKLFCLQPLI
jgi:predicted aspartyl protease